MWEQWKMDIYKSTISSIGSLYQKRPSCKRHNMIKTSRLSYPFHPFIGGKSLNMSIIPRFVSSIYAIVPKGITLSSRSSELIRICNYKIHIQVGSFLKGNCKINSFRVTTRFKTAGRSLPAVFLSFLIRMLLYHLVMQSGLLLLPHTFIFIY